MKKHSAKNLMSDALPKAEQAADALAQAAKMAMVTLSTKGDRPVHTPKRVRLPEVRSGLTKKAQACGMEYYITVNFFPNSVQPAECFCRIAKEGSAIAGFVEALMITISIAFQYGVPWDVLFNKFLHQIFEPRDDENSSLVDAIGKTISDVIKIWEDTHADRNSV